MEKLDYLIKYLLEENNQVYEEIKDELEKKQLYRALVNVRKPKNISEEFLEIEDKYLQGELSKQNVVNIDDINTIKESYNVESYSKIINADKICLWRGNITKLKIDAIVNAGNSQGLGCFLPNHNCIDNQINTFAGVRLRLACNDIMKNLNYNLETGKAIITKGYNLLAKYIIQTVGPIVEYNLTEELEKKLADCYYNSLNLAIERKIRSISFPCISTGVFRFPKKEASKIAIKTVDSFVSKNRDKFDKIVFNLWSEEDVSIYEQNIR